MFLYKLRKERCTMKHELTTLRLWNPLFPHIYLRNEWGDLDNDSVDLTAGEILEYEDKILDLIEKEKLSNEGKRDLAVYLDDDLSRKIHSINPSVEEWNGELWGVTEVQTYGDLSPSDLSELTDWLSGQFSDGWSKGKSEWMTASCMSAFGIASTVSSLSRRANSKIASPPALA